jgi:uncharacterized protein (TIGR03067 family)
MFFMPAQAGPDDVKKEIERFQGSWIISSMNGEAVPPEAEAYLVFKGDKYEQWTGTEVNERGSFKLDLTSKPAKMDLTITEGQDAGKTQFGVYELSSDTLTVSMAMAGETGRPAALHQGAINAVLKKTK